MSFQLHRMRDVKSDEIFTMKSIIGKSKTRTRPVYDIKKTLTDNINIIAELKHASPSAGNLTGTAGDTDIIQRYINGGASALSVLTEKNHFNGSYEHLQTVSSSCDKPVLCKDFIYFEEQVEAAYLCGADLVLLISRVLDNDTMKILYHKIKSYGMTPLVEIHEKREIDDIMFLDPEIVMVNMRNLETLEIDTLTGIKTLTALPSSVTTISASGINSKDDIAYIMDKSGTNNFLIGSSLMKSGDPEKMIMEFKNVC
ncbi:MAG TPA: indole-3-glycerol-phosphate synthase [Spirochaetota bacterium]|nr:indole-3-glycerol-phosphate synthase [Spirochaetota bacterium]HPS87674.1 indole-3-glycerol-phosphate synthase [Spirochaetota bacterium]